MFLEINSCSNNDLNLELNDVELVEKVKQKDVDSFELLYKKYIDKIYTLAFRITQNQNTAEELTQDIFVRIWEKINSFKGNSSFFTWLYRISLNLILNDKRFRLRQDENEIYVKDISAFHNESINSKIDAKIDIEKAIATLPRRAREILILYDVEGLQHEEIARLTNISVGTSKAHLHRARKLLKEALNYEL